MLPKYLLNLWPSRPNVGGQLVALTYAGVPFYSERLGPLTNCIKMYLDIQKYLLRDQKRIGTSDKFYLNDIIAQRAVDVNEYMNESYAMTHE